MCCQEWCNELVESCAKLIGTLLMISSGILALITFVGSITIGIVAFSDVSIDSVLDLPGWLLKSTFGMCIVIFMISLLGLIGTYCEKKRAQENFNNAVDKDDGKESCGRTCMLIFLIFFLLMGFIHIGLGVTSLSYGGDMSDDSRFSIKGALASNKTANTVSGFSRSTELYLYNKYSATQWYSTDWIQLQNWFDCCGYSMSDTRTWTGDCCPNPKCGGDITGKPTSTSVEGGCAAAAPAMAPTPAAAAAPTPAAAAAPTPAASAAPTPAAAAPTPAPTPGRRRLLMVEEVSHARQLEDAVKEIPNAVPATTTTMPCLAKGKGTCSESLASNFKSAGYFLLFLGCYELLMAMLGFCLRCCASGDENGEYGAQR